jgi:MoxR-like ATPase
LLQSILVEDAAPVLLIDEIDRADEAFEAFLLELLSDYQITIPEMGTIHATHVPYVVLTSNRSRELGDALKRRCLYQWIDYPNLEKEMKIVRTRLPGIEEELARQVVGYVQSVRSLTLSKPPGVAETLDCAQALLALGKLRMDEAAIDETLGCISKSVEDGVKIRSAGLEKTSDAGQLKRT